MRVSIIIPTYNEEKVIGECLESLSRQSFCDMEIIVIDDGSCDDTLKELQNSRYSELQVLTQKHRGAGAARNLGARQAKGDILVFVDADMTFEKDFIRKLIDPIVGKVNVGTFSKEEYLANKNDIWAVCWNINRGLPRDRMHPEDYPDHQPVFRAILKREFDRAGGFDERAGYTDDWSLSKKLGVEAVNAPGAVFYHKNPTTLSEVFFQAKWMAKRNYKFGFLGGFAKAWFPIKLSPSFLIFKLVYAAGATIGIVEYFVFGKVSK